MFSLESVVLLDFRLCRSLLHAILGVSVSFLFGVWDRMWNSIVSVPDHCLFIFFDLVSETKHELNVILSDCQHYYIHMTVYSKFAACQHE